MHEYLVYVKHFAQFDLCFVGQFCIDKYSVNTLSSRPFEHRVDVELMMRTEQLKALGRYQITRRASWI